MIGENTEQIFLYTSVYLLKYDDSIGNKYIPHIIVLFVANIRTWKPPEKLKVKI